MALEEAHNLLHTEGLVIAVFQHCDGAHGQVGAVFVHAHNNLLTAGALHRDHALGLGPVRRPLINKGVDQNPPDLGDHSAVDPQVLAPRRGAAPVVAVQRHKRRARQAPEGIAQGLDAALLSVLQLEQAAQVQVDGLGAGGEEAASVGGLVPVQVNQNLAQSGAAALAQVDLLTLAQFYLGRKGLRRRLRLGGRLGGAGRLLAAVGPEQVA